MPKRRVEQRRALGPHPHGRGFRVVTVEADGTRTYSKIFETESRAKSYKEQLEAEWANQQERTIGEVISDYLTYMREVKRNRPLSVKTTNDRLRQFFPEAERPISSLTERNLAERYAALSTSCAVDTHRNALVQTKTFLNWCVSQKLLPKNPAASLNGVGRRRQGKDQLRVDESRRWLSTALEMAQGGNRGALAATLALLLGLRCHEIVERQVRDVDDDGRLFWVPCSKTPAGRRRVQVPEVLRPLLRNLTRDRAGEEPLWGESRYRSWPRRWAARISAKAGVPRVTAHGLRGSHATLAEESGVSSHAVAKALGHESTRITHAAYTRPEAVESARQGRVLAALAQSRESIPNRSQRRRWRLGRAKRLAAAGG
jgi:integrase